MYKHEACFIRIWKLKKSRTVDTILIKNVVKIDQIYA